MKTPLQQLIKYIEHSFGGSDKTAVAIHKKALQLVEEEKKMVIDSFTAGQLDIVKTFELVACIEIPEARNDTEDGAQYFNETFK